MWSIYEKISSKRPSIHPRMGGEPQSLYGWRCRQEYMCIQQVGKGNLSGFFSNLKLKRVGKRGEASAQSHEQASTYSLT